MLNTVRKYATLAPDPRVRGAGMGTFVNANLGNQSTL
jgi:hypothetical protein